MSIIYVLIPIAIIFVAVAVAIFFWAVKSNQFEDLEKEGMNILFDEDTPANNIENKKKQARPQEKDKVKDNADQ